MTTTELLARRERLLGTGTPLFYQEAVNIVRGEGVWLFDPDGRRYLDMYNNVPCVGHCHPHVVEAMHRQASTLNVHSRYLHEGVLNYAERLTNHHAEELASVVFTCTGTEANEVAMGMARIATGGRGIICTNAAYHGNSAEVGKLTRARDGDPEIRAIPYPQRYRPLREGVPESELTNLYLSEVRTAIDSFAANDMSPSRACWSVPFSPTKAYPTSRTVLCRKLPKWFAMQAVCSSLTKCRQASAGPGKWWGYEVMDFVPDIVTMGKPMGNGLPLAATVARTELVDAFRDRKRYFNTFASSPLQAAVGMAVLEVIETENLRQNVAHVGEYLRAELTKLQPHCPPMAEVRGHGLFIGLEWVSDRDAKTPDRDGATAFVNRLKERGFLVGSAGSLGNVLKIRPPLVFAREHADLFLTAFEEIAEDIYGKGT